MDIGNSAGRHLMPSNSPAAAPHLPDTNKGKTTAVTTGSTPDGLLPIPPNTSQSGLVSRSAFPKEETTPQLQTSGTSAAERTLKPYGITMLPEKIVPEEQAYLNRA